MMGLVKPEYLDFDETNPYLVCYLYIHRLNVGDVYKIHDFMIWIGGKHIEFKRFKGYTWGETPYYLKERYPIEFIEWLKSQI